MEVTDSDESAFLEPPPVWVMKSKVTYVSYMFMSLQIEIHIAYQIEKYPLSLVILVDPLALQGAALKTLL